MDCYCVPDSTMGKPVTLDFLQESDLECLLPPSKKIEYRYHKRFGKYKMKKILYCNRCLQTDSWLNEKMRLVEPPPRKVAASFKKKND
jgi:hypothetical protein